MKKTLVWFVISAAFIGPGTVTTATNAGAAFGPALLWTIVFAVLACILLQEGSARINIASGLSLGQAISKQFQSKSNPNLIAYGITISVVLGCAAYEAGNILGAVSGVSLASGVNTKVLTIIIILIAALLLYTNKFNLITNFLAAIIGVMGLGLLVIALSLDLEFIPVIKGVVIPKIPVGSELLTIGLIGTTVVPYNLFLGSRLAKAQEIRSMRRGLSISVVVGGLISMSLVLIGSQINGEFSFANISETLIRLTGPWAHYLFAFGLFAAGITSAITAPWAASITLTSTLQPKNKKRAFKNTWILVLAAGLIFGVSEVKPIPIIILAQALNGILLPFLSIAILLILNNANIMKSYKNRSIGNVLLLFVVWITSILGLLNLFKAVNSMLGSNITIDNTLLVILTSVAFLLTVIVGIVVQKTSKNQ